MATQQTGLLSATSAPSLYNLLGQQTNNQYWGDLMAIENAKRVANIGEGRGLRDLIKQAAQKLGYTGQMYGASGAQDLAGIAAQMGISPEQLASMQSGAQGAWMKDGDIGKRDQTITDTLRADYTDKQMLDWLTSQGYTVDTVDTGREHVQQLRGPNGEIVAVDASNYINDNKAVDRMGMAGALITGGLAAFGGLGAGAAGASAGAAPSAGGISTLSPGLTGTAPVLTTPGLTAAEIGFGTMAPSGAFTAGLGGTVPLSIAAPALGAVGGLAGGAGGAGSGAAAIGGGEGAAALGGESFMGGVSYGAVPEGLSTVPGQLGGLGAVPDAAFGTMGGLVGGSSAFTLPAAVASGGLLSGLGNAIGGIANAVGGAKNLAGIVGGVAGALDGGKTQTATTTQQIDPRMAQYLYGTGYGDKASLLGAAQDWWKNNQSGMNANMQQGLDTLKSLYTSPGYTQGYTQMRDVGQGLLGRPIAGNPFTQGGLLGAPQMPAQGQQTPPAPDVGVPPQMMQVPPLGLLQGTQQMPGPDVGLQKFNRPAWSI